MSIKIRATSAVTAFGSNTNSLMEGILGGQQPPSEVNFNAEGDCPVLKANLNSLERFIPKRRLRRVAPFTRMALLAVFEVLEKSGIKVEGDERTGVIFGIGYGPLTTSFEFLDSIIDGGDDCASPTTFAKSVHNSLASDVAIALNISGPTVSLSMFEQTCAGVLQLASLWLERHEVDRVIVGFGDEYHEVLDSVRQRELDKVEEQPVTVPFGEQFACLLLERSDKSESEDVVELSSVVTGRPVEDFDGDETRPSKATLISPPRTLAGKAQWAMNLNPETPVACYDNLLGYSNTCMGLNVVIASEILRTRTVPPSAHSFDLPGFEFFDKCQSLQPASSVGILGASQSRYDLVILRGS